MLFNSFEFLIFFSIVFIIYWLLGKNLKLQNIFIVVASYFFYGSWDWRFLFLIFVTTLSCYISGNIIDASSYKTKRKTACALNIIINIAILCFFKYFNFFSENIRILFSQFGYQLDWFTLDVLLPVGISFYTFQAISYPIDVYRKKIAHTKDFVAFSAYISFFPQLVAGPIERSTQLLPQIITNREFKYDEAVSGMRQILWGFFKKIVIADNCAMFVNIIFSDYENYSAPVLWLGAFLFCFQIYGDFSGYSDIAIGIAKLLGINLSHNFHYPYFSINLADFWRRWHISLNSWFRDYVYIPLGGSRCSKYKTMRNVMIIFLLSGLWHGADWTFIIWGLYHGLLVLPFVLLKNTRGHQEKTSSQTFFPSCKEFFQMIITFGIVSIGWVIFRSNSVWDSFHYLWICISGLTSFSDIYNIFDIGSKAVLVFTLFMIFFMIIVEWTQRKKSYGLQIVEQRPFVIRQCIYIMILFCILILSGEQEQFIYFQF